MSDASRDIPHKVISLCGGKHCCPQVRLHVDGDGGVDILEGEDVLVRMTKDHADELADVLHRHGYGKMKPLLVGTKGFRIVGK